jgi:hypothetical protein
MRYLCLLIGEPDIEAPVPGTPEFAQMRSRPGGGRRPGGVRVGGRPLDQRAAAVGSVRMADHRGQEPRHGPAPPGGPAVRQEARRDGLREDSQSERWHLLHACRADLLRRLGRTAEAGEAYRAALALDPPPAEREFLAGRLAELDS